jgi:DNA-binding beta-propeller fold protein YncE
VTRERLLRTIPVPAYASGVRVTPNGRFVLAAAGRGAVVLDVAAALSGTGGAVLGSVTAPAKVAGGGPGAAEVAVSPDSSYAFVTLEGAGVVAVFDLRGRFGPGAFVGAVPVGAGALGIAASPDGRWLYEVSESARARSSRRRGVLNVIELARAVRAPVTAVVATAPAPCAPVRVAVSPDGATVWVTARDGDAVLGFNTADLRSDPSRALTSSTRVGPQPLGIVTTAGGNRLLVADSNLSKSPGARAGVSVVNDLVRASGARRLASDRRASLADAIAAPAGMPTALVTVSDSRAVDTFPVPR